MTTVASTLPARPASAEDLAPITLAQWHAVLAGEPGSAAGRLGAAAQLGHADAQAVPGQWRLDGHGVAHDATIALHWFLRAAHRGHALALPHARSNPANLPAAGSDVARDHVQAVALLPDSPQPALRAIGARMGSQADG